MSKVLQVQTSQATSGIFVVWSLLFQFASSAIDDSKRSASAHHGLADHSNASCNEQKMQILPPASQMRLLSAHSVLSFPGPHSLLHLRPHLPQSSECSLRLKVVSPQQPASEV